MSAHRAEPEVLQFGPLVRQPVETRRLIEETVRAEVARVLNSTGRQPGPVAIGVGSRGIANLERIAPAMGSHGAATAEGQAAVPASYGITPERVGAPVRATKDMCKHTSGYEHGRRTAVACQIAAIPAATRRSGCSTRRVLYSTVGGGVDVEF